MYPRYEDDWYNYPYGQEAYYSPAPYGSDFLYDPFYDERQFGPGVPPFSGPPSGTPQGFPGMQPPMGTPGQGFPGSQPPMGTPGQGFPGSQPPMGPSGQGPSSGPPAAPPPSYVPTQTMQASAFAVDPGSIRRCLFRYTYIWMRNRQQFWFYPIFLGRNSVAGWRWTGFRWMYFGISLSQIQSFTCV